MKSTFILWLDTFLYEKNPPNTVWKIIDGNGYTHIMDTDVVIKAIKNSPTEDQMRIKNILIKIDFYNFDVNHFFLHLAQGIVEQYEG